MGIVKLQTDSSTLSADQIDQFAVNLEEYRNHLQKVVSSGTYDEPESSLNLISDNTLLEKVTTLKEKMVTSSLKYIIDIGIGGSNLGTKAIYDALGGAFDSISLRKDPKILFADTTDPELLSKILDLVSQCQSADELLINVISKSGGTTETVANLEILWQGLIQKFPDLAKRVVVTTDHGTKLEEVAHQKQIAVLEIPSLVGGRFSVFSAVGLFPLLCAGVDSTKLREGALKMRDLCLQEVSENPAMMSAIILYKLSLEGKVINDNFFFHPELESLGKWYRQLMGESLGKEKNLSGEVVQAGITPTVSIGSTDLHSMAQLYLGGPKNKLTTFIYSEVSEQVKLPEKLEFSGLVEHLEGKSLDQIMSAIFQGVKIAYRNHQLPFMEVSLKDISEESLGEYLQFKMIEMMYLGKLLQVNTFDQPNVESYKVETKKILSA